MNPKPLTIVCGLLALALGLGLGACGKLHPAPEVVVWDVDPFRISVSDTTESSVTVLLRNMNKVDAVVTSERWDFLGTATPSPVTIYIPADTSVTITYDFSVPAKIAYRNTMIASGVTDATINVVYSGVDMYGDGKTFTTNWKIALVRYP